MIALVERPRDLAAATFAELVDRDPPWLAALRRGAWARALELPLPSPTEERWRLTDPAPFDLARYSPLAGSPAVASLGAVGLPPLDQGAPAALSLQIDGAPHLVRLGDAARRAGVILCSLEQAALEHEALLRPRLATLAGSDELFSARALALLRGGTFLYVPRHVELEAPIQALSWLSRGGLALHPRTVAVVERGARVVVCDHSCSAAVEPAALAMPVTELFVEDGAQLGWVSWQGWGAGVNTLAMVRASVGRGARLRTLQITLGGALSRSSLEVRLDGEGAGSELLGLACPQGQQQVEHWTLQDHRAAHTRSDLLYRGVLDGESRSLYYGTIRVGPHARRADAYQASHNLLLCASARADSRPQLEIAHNDVRCTHGATVGPIDEQQLYYLMSRGIGRREATRLIVGGFLDAVLARGRWSGLSHALERAISAHGARLEVHP
jgi:Fe-S cluster assembly protein SufD